MIVRRATGVVRGPLRVLFASCHGYIDHVSGAALATRDMMELLAAEGVACRVLSTGVVDSPGEASLRQSLGSLRVPLQPRRCGRSVLVDLDLGGVGVTVLQTASSRIEHSPDEAETRALLAEAERLFDAFRPHAMLTYGGHLANHELMARARRRGIPVVFHLRNLGYQYRCTFENVSAVVVMSEFARRHYAGELGLDSLVIADPVRADRVVAAGARPRYLTFVNPEPAKGVAVFARIAVELARRRPDIPLMVVEGRGTMDDLARVDLDLSGLRNVYWMASTPDPRAFYRHSRAVLVPSLVRETFGRVAAESLANGLPVLASDRGALPETLGETGFVFHVPEAYGPAGVAVPTAREVEPWLETIERLWDDAGFEAGQRETARREAARWDTRTFVTRLTGLLFSLLV